WSDALYKEGGKLHTASVQRNSPRATNPAFKTGNYLNNVMAIDEAKKVGATEALMLSASGHLTECTTSNVFFVKGGVVFTPELAVGILSGVTRAKVVQVCKELGQKVKEGLYPPADILGADEAFITSTTRDVMPITRIDDHAIGNGCPGPVTQKLIGAYRALCEKAIAHG
ncbi:MAG: aminotransferase class IV, partial [Planctomycetes bacterium]|nr:aminotransferase class IV [Planctomycetota bacterium]